MSYFDLIINFIEVSLLVLFFYLVLCQRVSLNKLIISVLVLFINVCLLNYYDCSQFVSVVTAIPLMGLLIYWNSENSIIDCLMIALFGHVIDIVANVLSLMVTWVLVNCLNMVIRFEITVIFSKIIMAILVVIVARGINGNNLMFSRNHYFSFVLVLVLILYEILLFVILKQDIFTVDKFVEIVIVSLLIFLGYEFIKKAMFFQQENMELKYLNKELSLNQRNLETMKDNIRETKRIRHDLKHQLLALKVLSKKDSNLFEQAIDQQIRELNELGKLNNQINSELDYLINNYINQAKAKKIDFVCFKDIHNPIWIDLVDFYTMIGNLLDNAIENSNKKVLFDLEINQEKMQVVIKNTIDKTLNNLKTTKKNYNDHGLGIDSVKRLVAKYNGKISIRSSENYFVVTIIIYK